MIPAELLAESKEGFEPIPWPLLQRTPEKRSLLVPGDVLGVYVEGVLGDESRLPPVNIPASGNIPPSMGYPIPVRSDGTISIPLIDPLPVEGLTIEDAEAKLVKAYTVDKKILAPGEERIILTMIRQKHVQINVIRQDSLGPGSAAVCAHGTRTPWKYDHPDQYNSAKPRFRRGCSRERSRCADGTSPHRWIARVRCKT